jgi:microcystin-dependent protein
MAAIGLLQFANQATTTLATTITSSQTSISVAAGTGALFPSPASGQYFKITIYPASGSTPAPEILHVTARSTDTLTVIRAQEGTAAQNWASGSLVENLITAGTLNSFGQVTQYAGNPNGYVAGFAASSSNPPSMVWDTTDGIMWVCTTSGPASTAAWTAQAPLSSPNFNGTPTAPTAAAGTSTTQLATTAFVTQAVSHVGDIKASAASGAQALWLLCYGQAVSRTTYSALFSAIGTAWGAGDGSTTFNIPDLRGRVLAGLDSMGGISANRLSSVISSTTLGAAGGDQNLQAHSHGVNDPGHSHGVNDPGHIHGLDNVWTADPAWPFVNEIYASPNRFYGQTQTYTGYTGIIIDAAYTGISIDSNGAGGSQNVQPTAIINYYIFAGV